MELTNIKEIILYSENIINNSAIEELIMLNTIPLPNQEGLEKFKSISVAPIFAEAIKRIYDDEPISKLFEN